MLADTSRGQNYAKYYTAERKLAWLGRLLRQEMRWVYSTCTTPTDPHGAIGAGGELPKTPSTCVL